MTCGLDEENTLKSGRIWLFRNCNLIMIIGVVYVPLGIEKRVGCTTPSSHPLKCIALVLLLLILCQKDL